MHAEVPSCAKAICMRSCFFFIYSIDNAGDVLKAQHIEAHLAQISIPS